MIIKFAIVKYYSLKKKKMTKKYILPGYLTCLKLAAVTEDFYITHGIIPE